LEIVHRIYKLHVQNFKFLTQNSDSPTHGMTKECLEIGSGKKKRG